MGACFLFIGAWISFVVIRDVESWDWYLHGYRGPYRGRVIDAATKKPLAGAVVVAIWEREIWQIIQSNTIPYKAREVLTDSNGDFVINARALELFAPPLTLRPHFVIFLPGYGLYPIFQTAPTGFTGGNFEGEGTLVELPRVKGKEKRESYDEIDSGGISEDRFKELPNLMRLINQERINLGFEPYRQTEKQP